MNQIRLPEELKEATERASKEKRLAFFVAKVAESYGDKYTEESKDRFLKILDTVSEFIRVLARNKTGREIPEGLPGAWIALSYLEDSEILAAIFGSFDDEPATPGSPEPDRAGSPEPPPAAPGTGERPEEEPDSTGEEDEEERRRKEDEKRRADLAAAGVKDYKRLGTRTLPRSR